MHDTTMHSSQLSGTQCSAAASYRTSNAKLIFVTAAEYGLQGLPAWLSCLVIAFVSHALGITAQVAW
jgi:hypothetical protein